MSAESFRAALETIGLSQAALARLLDTDKVTVNRWARGVAGVPPAVRLLLLVLLHTDLTTADLEAIKADASPPELC